MIEQTIHLWQQGREEGPMRLPGAVALVFAVAVVVPFVAFVAFVAQVAYVSLGK